MREKGGGGESSPSYGFQEKVLRLGNLVILFARGGPFRKQLRHASKGVEVKDVRPGGRSGPEERPLPPLDPAALGVHQRNNNPTNHGRADQVKPTISGWDRRMGLDHRPEQRNREIGIVTSALSD